MSHSYGKRYGLLPGKRILRGYRGKASLKNASRLEDAWWLNLPPEVELTIRGAGEEKFYFLLNYKTGSHAGLSDKRVLWIF